MTDHSALIERLEGEPGDCPFCGRDPYHYVDNGVGMERVAVTCCDEGIAYFQHGDPVLAEQMALRREAAAALRDLTEQKPKSMGQCAYELMRDFNDNSPAKPNDTTPWDSLSDEVQRSWNEDASRRYRLYGLRRDGTPRDPAIRTKMGLPLPSAPNQAKESGE